MAGKRGFTLKFAFALHVLGLVALIAGCVTPYWSRVLDETSGEVLAYSGLLVTYVPNGNWTFRDFNEFRDAGSDTTLLFGVLAVSLAFVAVFLEFFVVESYAFVLYNNSCGRRYNPDWLMVFSLLSGFVGVACLVLYEQYIGRSLPDATEVRMEYSRGFVILYISFAFSAAFFSLCDRSGAVSNKK